MNIRRARLRGILENGLQQAQHRRVGGVGRGRQLLDVDIAFLQIIPHRFGQCRDLVRLPIDGVERLQQVCLADEGEP